MFVVNRLNVCNYKKNIKAFEMVIGESYQICSATMGASKFGMRIILELNDYQLFLPTRFNTISITVLQELNNQTYKVTNLGPMGNSYNLVFTEYVENILASSLAAKDSETCLPDYLYYTKNFDSQ